MTRLEIRIEDHRVYFSGRIDLRAGFLRLIQFQNVAFS